MSYKFSAIELKVEMTRQNVTSDALAKACEVHPATISRLLGGSAPTYALMCKTASALKLSQARAAEIFFTPD
jgi:transcriptional regulator with XRE-family HTH domain